MSAWAKPGVKCLFVGGGLDKASDFPLLQGKPEHGVVYTIRDTKMGTRGHCKGELVLRLCETSVRPNGEAWEDAWLAVSTFRPLVTRTQEQDVALFTHLLEGKPVEVDA